MAINYSCDICEGPIEDSEDSCLPEDKLHGCPECRALFIKIAIEKLPSITVFDALVSLCDDRDSKTLDRVIELTKSRRES